MKNVYPIILFALICLISCKEGNRTIERPLFSVRNSSTLEIDKIILTDTATILHIEAFFIPNNWIRIDSLTYLQGNDIKYQITGSDGIELNKEFWMPESGEASFTLFFPPIDRKLKEIDFIESDCDDCFKIYGIDLTGKAAYLEYPKGLPEDVSNLKYDMSEPLPDASLEIGTNRINLHLLGYRKGMDNGKAVLYSARFFPSGEEEYEASIDENTGIATFEIEQYGTWMNMIRAAGQRISFVSSPGIMDIYVNLHEAGLQGSHYHKAESPEPVVYFAGKNAIINMALNNKNNNYKLNLENERIFNNIAGMNADEFIDYIITEYKNISDTINLATELSNIEKDLLLNENKMTLHYFILSGEHQLERAYRFKNKISWDQQTLKDFNTPQFTKKHYNKIKDYQIEGTKYLYTEMFPYIYPIYFSGKADLDTIIGPKDGFLYDLQKAYPLGFKIEEMEVLTDKEKTDLEAIKNPFFANTLSALDKKLQKQMEESKTKTGYTICEVPKVSNDQLFDAIAANYKGKVAFVDFWATWCGPCRSSIKKTEPLKETELKNENIVFVYITGETSPETKWRTTIPDIKGDHYRLSNEQWKYICDKFGINGIPSYVLIEKNGKYKLREDFHNHETMKKVLIEECSR
ncbi:MAG: TlpA family protein disulfide reductase [Tannerella sp.]|jgi:thiol-disulfide isomerase/thioredoxin|nr:TlpA family protein disulfide reductase [Tannerella sp.]